MDDLISRSQLLKEIENWGGCVEAMHEYISNMPTAYDIKNIVAELEEEKVKSIYDYNSAIDVKSAYGKAIDIVKAGVT